MTKLLLILLIPAGIIAAVVFYSIREDSKVSNIDTADSAPITAFSDTKAQEAKTPQPLPTAKDSSLEERVKALESSISIINKKIDVLSDTMSKTTATPVPVVTPLPSTTTTTSTSGPKSAYIPIGYGGSSVATSDFESLGTQEITIDTTDYPGYKSAVLEVNFKINNANGTGEARLFNTTDGTAILGSVVSTTSGSYSTKTSGTFSLASGTKKYNLQLKSSTGYSVDVQLARIRIDF